MLEGLDTKLDRVKCLQNILVDRATGGSGDDEVFQLVRLELLRDEALKPLMPSFLKTCRGQSQFWQLIKTKFSTYAKRREFIWSEFSPILNELEGTTSSPSDATVSQILEKFDSEHVRQIWQKALARRESEPDGAITAARALLESVCKHVLDDAGVNYDPDNASLPKLYSLASRQLNLAPSQHTEEVFKRILGGCASVVEGLGSLRNRLGDAHGKGKLPARPAPRHAELAVNLAGSMATFLIQTWEANAAGFRDER